MPTKPIDMETLRKLVRSILLVKKNEYERHEFLAIFKEMQGQEFPYATLGFESDLELIKSMSDVVHIRQRGTRIFFCPVITPEISHIFKMKQGEKVSKNNSGRLRAPQQPPRPRGFQAPRMPPQRIPPQRMPPQRMQPQRMQHHGMPPQRMPTQGMTTQRMPPRLMPTSTGDSLSPSSDREAPHSGEMLSGDDGYRDASLEDEIFAPQPKSKDFSSNSSLRPFIPESHLCKLMTLLEENPRGSSATRLSSAYRRRWNEDLDVVSWGFSDVLDALNNGLRDLVVSQPLDNGDSLVLSRRCVPKYRLEAYDAIVKAGPTGESTTTTTTLATDTTVSASPTIDSTRDALHAVRDVFQSILDEHPGGVRLTKMLWRFKAIAGREIPVEELGFASAYDLFVGMKDLFLVEKSCGDYLLSDAKRRGTTTTTTSSYVGTNIGTSASAASIASMASARSAAAAAAAVAEPSHSLINSMDKVEALKDVLVQVLKKCGPEGVPAHQIPRTFQYMTGKSLHPGDYGYRNIRAMIDSLRDICQLKRSSIQLANSETPVEVVVLSPLLAGDRIAETHLLPSVRGNSVDPVAKDSPIFSVSRPPELVVPHDAAGIHDRFQPPAELPHGIWLELEVSHVYSPGEFYYQAAGEERYELEILMARLQDCRGEDAFYRIPTEILMEGLICVAKYENQWHRAVIERVCHPPEVEIFYVDYGTKASKSYHELRLINRRFLTLPMQARLASLAGIRPVNADGTWSQESYLALLDFAHRTNRLMGKIEMRDSHGDCMFLAEFIGDQHRYINDELFDGGLAAPLGDFKTVVSPRGGGSSSSSSKPDANSSSIRLIFHGSRVFVFVLAPELESVPLEAITIGGAIYVTRDSLSRLLWPDASIKVAAALKQKPLPEDSTATRKTETVQLTHLPALRNEVIQANLGSSRDADGQPRPKIVVYELEDLAKLARHFGAAFERILVGAAKEIGEAWRSGTLEIFKRRPGSEEESQRTRAWRDAADPFRNRGDEGTTTKTKTLISSSRGLKEEADRIINNYSSFNGLAFNHQIPSANSLEEEEEEEIFVSDYEDDDNEDLDDTAHLIEWTRSAAALVSLRDQLQFWVTKKQEILMEMVKPEAMKSTPMKQLVDRLSYVEGQLGKLRARQDNRPSPSSAFVPISPAAPTQRLNAASFHPSGVSGGVDTPPLYSVSSCSAESNLNSFDSSSSSSRVESAAKRIDQAFRNITID